MSLLTFDNVVFRFYAVVASLLIIKMMSQGWITVFRMIKVNGGYRYPEDAERTSINPHPNPGQLLPNEYVERSRRIHGNDIENIPLFLIVGLLFVCTGPNQIVALALFAVYLLSRLIHFYIVMTARSHDSRATFWTIGSGVVYVMAGLVLWRALRPW